MSKYIYIPSTASERIVDTLELFPHNSPMPQLSSTDRLIMAANDMTDALKHPHTDVPFNTDGYDTIKALTTLAAIFKNKCNKPPAPELIDSPIKAAENKRPAVLIQTVLKSPVKHTYQTRSQTELNQVPAHLRESQKLATTSEDDYPSNKKCSTSEGAAKGSPPPETCPKETYGIWAAPTTP
jgi:hypothetical protein